MVSRFEMCRTDLRHLIMQLYLMSAGSSARELSTPYRISNLTAAFRQTESSDLKPGEPLSTLGTSLETGSCIAACR